MSEPKAGNDRDGFVTIPVEEYRRLLAAAEDLRHIQRYPPRETSSSPLWPNDE